VLTLLYVNAGLFPIFIYAEHNAGAVVEGILGECPSNRGAEWRTQKAEKSRRRRPLVGWLWGGVSPPQPTKEVWGASWAPLRFRFQGRAPAGNAFWRILKATRSFLQLYADAFSSSNSVSCHITYQVRITYTPLSFASRDTGGYIKWTEYVVYIVTVLLYLVVAAGTSTCNQVFVAKTHARWLISKLEIGRHFEAHELSSWIASSMTLHQRLFPEIGQAVCNL